MRLHLTSIVENSVVPLSLQPWERRSSGMIFSCTARWPAWCSASFFFLRRPTDGDTQLLRHLFRWLCRTTDRRLHLRPLRRPCRTQVYPHHHFGTDGSFDFLSRISARLRDDWPVGSGAPDHFAASAGYRRGRRMGRVRAPFYGMGAAE